MPIPHSSTEPDFVLFKRSCGLDFIRLFSETTKVLPLSPARTKIRPLRAYGHDGMILTIQEPKVKDVEIIAKELPTAIFDAVEVYFDFTPKGVISALERQNRIEDVRQWVLSHLYPWQALGIQAATRVSKGWKHSEPVYFGDVERRAARYETMYFGHSDSIFADPDEPNLASMRLYRKITDGGRHLSPSKHRCRLELTMNQAGCKHFGLVDPASLFGFNFRQFAPYFRLVKPEVRPCVMPKLRASNPRMAELLERTKLRMAAGTLSNVGSHAASREKLLNVDGHHRHKEGNRMIQLRLDDLTRRFKKSRESSSYGDEWGSW
jgi:hypothetical protein